MAGGRRGNTLVRAYLESHGVTLQGLPFRLISELPDVAAAMVRAGGTVRLENPRGGSWQLNLEALGALINVDAPAATQILNASQEKFAAALEAPQPHDMKDLANFIQLADGLDSSFLDKVLTSLDAAACEPVWRQRLDDAGVDARALVERAARVIQVPVRDAARRLMADVTGPRSPRRTTRSELDDSRRVGKYVGSSMTPTTSRVVMVMQRAQGPLRRARLRTLGLPSEVFLLPSPTLGATCHGDERAFEERRAIDLRTARDAICGHISRRFVIAARRAATEFVNLDEAPVRGCY